MNDLNSGVGGSYAIDPATGERKLISRTDYAPPASDAPNQPATAGFFTPVESVAPADKPTTTTE
ncbi:hypothetical protein [Rugamonas sp.]|uniref:hypothetical protein n=1 Tax=Rugamonas sp. TaxID=1926287 RepID=UPI0026006CC6|nr:hypothetical protein [Rugamonas sp.]